jgi:DNA-binding HxlR family transcriptional regulator
LKLKKYGRIIGVAIPLPTGRSWDQNQHGASGTSALTQQTKRAGATALALLSSPLNVRVLQALESGRLSPLDLRRAASWPPPSTMRVYLRNLQGMGVLEQRRYEAFPPTVEYALTPSGKALLKVGNDLQAWLNTAPEGPILLGSPGSKSATGALVEGWSSNIVRALASQPYSLTQLSRLNVQTSYPALERRLSAMRVVDLVEPHPGNGRGTPYRATGWLRRAVSPLTASTAWERKYLPDATARIGRLDVEAAFLLTAPMLQLPSTLGGKVRLAVEMQGGNAPAHAGAVLEIEDGMVASSSARLDGDADASISGSAIGWLRQMNGNSALHVEFGGDRALGEMVTEALRAIAAELSAPPKRSPK